MARYFAPIEPETLKEKVDAILAKGSAALLAHLGSDIKVRFDLENFSDSPREFGPKQILGLRTRPSGLVYHGFAAGGDWESPVFFIAYWDGKKLRGYVPTDGNPWNTDTKWAFGNDDAADLANARRRWPDAFADAKDVYHAFSFNPGKILHDIDARILPVPTVRPGRTTTGAPSMLDRLGGLRYYQPNNEVGELFQTMTRLCYQLHGFSDPRAETVFAWAKEMAETSRAEFVEEGGDPDTSSDYVTGAD